MQINDSKQKCVNGCLYYIAIYYIHFPFILWYRLVWMCGIHAVAKVGLISFVGSFLRLLLHAIAVGHSGLTADSRHSLVFSPCSSNFSNSSNLKHFLARPKHSLVLIPAGTSILRRRHLPQGRKRVVYTWFISNGSLMACGLQRKQAGRKETVNGWICPRSGILDWYMLCWD